ncbi:MAG: hypothetical protein CL600_09875 [Alteromonas sp.]|nr:hypothetical protein [Alteromonas sp.]
MEDENNNQYLDHDGKVAFVPLEDFESKVSNGQVCFLCANEFDCENTTVTDEHIIPQWILRKFDLFNNQVTLPNRTKFYYRSYVIPCCLSCNELLSKNLENPLSKLLGSGFKFFIENVDEEMLHKIFFWFATLFTKTHIKDQSLQMSRDRRRPMSTLAESLEYDWSRFLHTYSMCRSLYTNATYTSHCIGSIFVTHVDSRGIEKNFDYFDVSYAQTAGILIDDIGIIVVFDDAGAVSEALDKPLLSKLNDSVTSIQLRELTARFACCNLHIKNPPNFSTYLSPFKSRTQTYINCSFTEPAPTFHEYRPEILGGLMEMLLGGLMEGKVNVKDYWETLRKGHLSFIFDNDGNIISPDNSYQQ